MPRPGGAPLTAERESAGPQATPGIEELAGLLTAGRRRAAAHRVAGWGSDDAVFGHLDGRLLAP
ncbi:hypothetical protein [Pseudonocardia sp. MH-G8]|uniref:hypothetical protein n=1 Tax=Pseudonocardia sp. MH-G8 TaxID=1854588 RepID=UPI000BA17993|nr:hypothetical protein [Pseudonocardia sp. MH-G8]OZM82429.1 hypothetical protein CFP66_11860 [Pseudonocardia sp. MH-G8]